jgi:fructose-bisphosphate aldolase class II
MLVNAREILNNAMKEKYAVPQFNINNLEWTRYILEVCQEYRSPLILGVSEGAVKYMGGYKTVYNIVINLMEYLNISIPVVLHLDHGQSFETCKKAIDAGFTSVMIDGSSYSLEENIKLTSSVVSYAHSKDVTVEAEVGHIGGVEDNVSGEVAYAKVEDCINLVKATKVDFLAPALGSIHGIYKGEPKINFQKMKDIRDNINLPLVLHGGTGLSYKVIQESISCGICKININTELQVAWAKGVRSFLNQNESVYDPRKIIGSGEKKIKSAINDKIMLFMSNNRA